MRFLSGVNCPEAIELGIGLIGQPGTYGPNVYPLYPEWAYDNGCFRWQIAPGNEWETRWLRRLDALVGIPKCLFAVVPDMACHESKPHDAPAAATLELFDRYEAATRERGFPVAFALQDGSEAPGMVPWDRIEAVFIGGTTEWKLSHHALGLVSEAKRRGLHAHMGRANSAKRFRRAQEMQVDTCDGNFLLWPKANALRLRAMLESLPEYPQLAWC